MCMCVQVYKYNLMSPFLLFVYELLQADIVLNNQFILERD